MSSMAGGAGGALAGAGGAIGSAGSTIAAGAGGFATGVAVGRCSYLTLSCRTILTLPITFRRWRYVRRDGARFKSCRSRNR